MSSETMSLKGRIKNLAKQKSVSAQILLQNYMNVGSSIGGH